MSPRRPHVSSPSIKRDLILDKQVWIEYVASWANPATDSQWGRWRYRLNKYWGDYFEPPGKTNLKLFPQLGLYSSHDKSLLLRHCLDLQSLGVDSIVLQWWGTNSSDEIETNNEGFSDKTVPILLEAAESVGMGVLLQIQPYPGRTNETIYRDIKYIMKKYGQHPAYTKIENKPVIIVYEPHSISSMFKSIAYLRQENIEPYLISSIVSRNHISLSLEDGFNAIFTYFPSEGFTWGSNITNWKYMKKDASERGLELIIAVGPGYDDGKHSYFDANPRRPRESGLYYDRMWQAAIETDPNFIVVNSWNQFYDGSFIEPVIERDDLRYTDENWAVNGKPDSYTQKTKSWIEKFKNSN